MFVDRVIIPTVIMVYEKKSIRRYRCLDESVEGLDSCSGSCRAAQ